MKEIKSKEGEIELQPKEYVPRGPVRIGPGLRKTKPVLPPPTKLPGHVVYVPFEERVKGHIYDDFSGMCLGLASDEEKAEHQAGIAYVRHRDGMKQKVVIW